MSSPSFRPLRHVAAAVLALLLTGVGHVAAAEGPTVRWYRTHVNGVPILSSTITEQHIRNGYEALDRNMQVVKRLPPYSASLQAQRKAKLDRERERLMADRNLVRLHGSSIAATAQRNRMLHDVQERRALVQRQLSDLALLRQQDVATAASHERRGQAIPAVLQRQIAQRDAEQTALVRNLSALQTQENSIRAQYDRAIARLVVLEKNPALLQDTPSVAVDRR